MAAWGFAFAATALLDVETFDDCFFAMAGIDKSLAGWKEMVVGKETGGHLSHIGAT